MEEAALDTNILIFAFHKHEEKKHALSAELVEKSLRGGITYHLSLQNLTEFFHVTTTTLDKKLDPDEAEKIVNDFIKWPGIKVHEPQTEDFLEAMKISEQYEVHFWDAMIAAVMKRTGVLKIYTDDSDFEKIPWIQAKKPWKD